MGSSKKKSKTKPSQKVSRPNSVKHSPNIATSLEKQRDKFDSKAKSKTHQSASTEQVLQCLQNKCNVEVENIDYVLNGRKSIRLSELPEWYYCDDAFGFDYLSRALDQNSPKSTVTGTSELDYIDAVNNTDFKTDDVLDIKIVDTFSLVNSKANTNVVESSTTTNFEQCDVQRFGAENKQVLKRINQENGIHHHHDNEMVHTDDFMGLREEKSVLTTANNDLEPLPGISTEVKTVIPPTGIFTSLPCASTGSSSSDEVKSIFQSPQLDSILAVETRKLERNLDSLLERLNASSRNMPVSYTPKSQAGYVKTLKTALLERNKVLQTEKQVAGNGFIPISVISDDDQLLLRTVKPSFATSYKSIHENSKSSSVSKLSFIKKPIRLKPGLIPMLQVLSQSEVECALTVLQTDESLYFNEIPLIEEDNDSELISKTKLSVDTAGAIKKRLSKVPVSKTISNIHDSSDDNYDQNIAYIAACKKVYYSKLQTQPTSAFVVGPKRKIHVALNTDPDLFHTTVITQQLAEASLSTLKPNVNKKLKFRRSYPKIKDMKALKRLRRKLKCLKPISLTQAISKYLIYQGKKWRSDKMLRDFVSFSFHQLPVSISQIKDNPSHLKLRLAKHKLSWQEVLTSTGMMIFPGAYSVPDETVLYKTANSRGSDIMVHTLRSMTCARVRPFHQMLPKKQLKKKAPLRNLLPSATIASTFTMDRNISFQNLKGGVMVVQLSHSKRKNCHMTVKIMSCCEWGNKSEEVLNVIIENHYELQNLQRGRYIRTCMDDYLIEVLRCTSTQVSSANLPSPILLDMQQFPHVDVSLVKVSENDSSPSVPLKPDRLINFSEAIEDMFKLDKQLAASHTKDQKPKLLMLEQTKQDKKKGTVKPDNAKDISKRTSDDLLPSIAPKPKKKKKTPAPASSKVSGIASTKTTAVVSSANSQKPATTLASSSETVSTSDVTVKDFETLIDDIVALRRVNMELNNRRSFDTDPVKTTSSKSSPVACAVNSVLSSSTPAKENAKVSYHYALGRLGCLNNMLNTICVQKSITSLQTQIASSNAAEINTQTVSLPATAAFATARNEGSSAVISSPRGPILIPVIPGTSISSPVFAIAVTQPNLNAQVSKATTVVVASDGLGMSRPITTASAVPLPKLTPQPSIDPKDVPVSSPSETLPVLQPKPASITTFASIPMKSISLTSKDGSSSSVLPRLADGSFKFLSASIIPVSSTKAGMQNKLLICCPSTRYQVSSNKTGNVGAVQAQLVPVRPSITSIHSTARGLSTTTPSTFKARVSLPRLMPSSVAQAHPLSVRSCITSVQSTANRPLSSTSSTVLSRVSLSHVIPVTSSTGVSITSNASFTKKPLPSGTPTPLLKVGVPRLVHLGNSNYVFNAVPSSTSDSRKPSDKTMQSVKVINCTPVTTASSVSKPSAYQTFTIVNPMTSVSSVVTVRSNSKIVVRSPSLKGQRVSRTRTKIDPSQIILDSSELCPGKPVKRCTNSNTEEQPSAKSRKITPAVVDEKLTAVDPSFILSKEEATILRKICHNYTLLSKCNMCSMSADDVIQTVRDICQIDSSDIRWVPPRKRLTLLMGIFIEVINRTVDEAKGNISKSYQNRRKNPKEFETSSHIRTAKVRKIAPKLDPNEKTSENLAEDTQIDIVPFHSTTDDSSICSDSVVKQAETEAPEFSSNHQLHNTLPSKDTVDSTPVSSADDNSAVEPVIPIAPNSSTEQQPIHTFSADCSIVPDSSTEKHPSDTTSLMEDSITSDNLAEQQTSSTTSSAKLSKSICNFPSQVDGAKDEENSTNACDASNAIDVETCDADASGFCAENDPLAKRITDPTSLKQGSLSECHCDSVSASHLSSEQAVENDQDTKSPGQSSEQYEPILIIDDDVEEMMTSTESFSEHGESSTISDTSTTSNEKPNTLRELLEKKIYSAYAKSRISKTKSELLTKVHCSERFLKISASRKNMLNRLKDNAKQLRWIQGDSISLKEKPEGESTDLEIPDAQLSHIELERLRRTRMRQGFAHPEKNSSKISILREALKEIQFLNLEERNLALISEFVMSLNRNLQIYLGNLQSNISISPEELQELKNSLNIEKDKERLRAIERHHQVESMKLLKLAEADLSKIALLPRLLQPMPTFSNS